MVGDQSDMLARIKAVLPPQWFPDTTPILDGLLAGLAAGWAGLYSLLGYVKLQTRIATAADVFLDIIALDFFGSRIARSSGQADNAFRSRILLELLRERDTRAAVISVLSDLTGREPVVFEPARTTDTGGWGVALAYGVAGGWGSLALPFQCFITAFRPINTGIASVEGYGAGEASPPWAPGAATSRTTSATYIDQNGVMQTAGPGVARPLYSDGVLEGLLVEPAATNLSPNGNGANVSGNFPAGWSGGPGAGVGLTFLGNYIADGVPVVRYEFSGTASNGAIGIISAGASAAIPVSGDQIPAITRSFYARLVSGSLASIEVVQWGPVFDASGTDIQDSQPVIALSGVVQRYSNTSPTFTGDNGAPYSVYSGIVFYYGLGGAVNFTIDIGALQIETGDVTTSYIPTTSAAATRNADRLSVSQPGAGGWGAGSLPPGMDPGAIEYADQDMVASQVSDADVYAAIAATIPVATIAWTRITN